MRTFLLATALLSSGVSAQQLAYESFTDATQWSLPSSGGAVVNDPRSTFGKLYQLNSATSFTISRKPLLLNKGTYVATVRFAKITSAANSSPITFRAAGAANATEVVPVADQKVDSFLWTKSIVLEIPANGLPVLFSVSNTDANTEKDYMFDSFEIGEVADGRAVLVQSLGRRWGHSWGAPHFCKEHADKTSTFGFVERLNPPGSSNCGTGTANLWWFRWFSQPMSFAVGSYTANMRIKKVVSATGGHNFIYWYQVSTDGGQNWSPGTKLTWNKSQHVIDKWASSPNLSITVTDPKHLYRFRLDAFQNDPLLKQANSFKGNYYFDTFEVRKSQNSPTGVSCMNAGNGELHATVPQTGQTMRWSVGPAPGATTASLNVGVQNLNIDLSVIGWTSCFMYTDLLLVLPMAVANDFGTLSAPIPNNASLVGVKFNQQGWAVQGGGVETTNALQAAIGN